MSLPWQNRNISRSSSSTIMGLHHLNTNTIMALRHLSHPIPISIPSRYEEQER